MIIKRPPLYTSCLVILLLCLGLLAKAGEIYTCVDDKGRRSFSDRPCTAGAKQEKATPTSAPASAPLKAKKQHPSPGSHGGFVHRARNVEKTLNRRQR